MEKSIKMLFDAFQATFAVSTQMRPDGGALLTLRNGEEIVTRRVVSAAQLADEKRMYWFINAVRRDLALEAGACRWMWSVPCVVCRSAACRATWRAERFVRNPGGGLRQGGREC
ncbi:DUF3509 domain-containing protein [Pseudomonas aeruginosa]|nr:DUF3509 domain-containing protein [Pseudomonas aeruginosa]